jgi:enoyl-CoA hydratase/carnithine racemase
MDPADAILSGFADVYVPAGRLQELVAALIDQPDPSTIDAFAEPPPPADGGLEGQRGGIDRVFGLADVPSIARALAGPGAEPWREQASKALARSCPLSLHATLRMIRAARGMATVQEALAAEYRFVWRSLAEGEFMEGIRAAVIDKDRAPRWAKPDIADVGPADVASMLASLDDNELTF